MPTVTYSTKKILVQFGITRQTLYNWINNNEISKPEVDWRGWRMWQEKHIDEIKELIQKKQDRVHESAVNKNSLEGKNLFINNRRYLGSKYKLLPFIEDIINKECGEFKSFADIFGGTGVVANNFNTPNVKLIVNDLLYSNYVSYITWFSSFRYSKKKIVKLINEFNNEIPTKENYFSENFSNTYFSYENALKIGDIREKIELLEKNKEINVREKCILLTSLIYAMDKVANTCGHYDAFRKKIDTLNPIQLLVPHIEKKSNSNNVVYNMDSNKLVREISADIVYIDPPYNSRQYVDAYHLLENVAKWEKPKVEGVAKKMINRSSGKSYYCTVKATSAFEDLIENINAKFILVSYNNMAQKGVGRSNAKISDDEIYEILKAKGEVKIFDTDFKAFTTGKSNIDEHKERIFLCKVK